MVNITLERLPGENDEQFIWRLASAKDSGMLDITWTELAKVLNKGINEEGVYYTESAFRKKYQQAALFYNNVFSKMKDEEFLKDFTEQKRLLEIEKVKFRDERCEYNRVIRQEARKQSFLEMVKDTVCKDIKPIMFHLPQSLIESDCDMLLPLSDIHTGIEIDNFKNKFDEEILKRRIEIYTGEAIEIIRRHKVENLYVVASEILSGIIHYTLRLQNSMDMMQQFKYISELITSMLLELSQEVRKVYFYTAPGNHSRISPKKEESIDGENMDVLLPFYLKARLQNFKNIEIIDNMLDPEVPVFEIRGQKIMAAHGHKDSPSTVVQNFTLLYGWKPDIILLGHRHTNGYETTYDTKVIQSGSVSGTDDYILSKRKANKPEQAVSIINKNGLVCVYDITLDENEKDDKDYEGNI